MKYINLNGLRISSLILGTWQFGGLSAGWASIPLARLERVLYTALDNGINTLDTAHVYGESEKILGHLLKNLRQKCVLMTKGFGGPKKLRSNLEDSLKRLRTDYIDVYFIHYPAPNVPLEAQLETLQRLKEEGKIRAIGISNFSKSELTSVINFCHIDIIQDGLNILWQKPILDTTLQICAKNHISFIAYSPLLQGLLSQPNHPQTHILEKNIFLSSTLKPFLYRAQQLTSQLSHKYNTTSIIISLEWVLQTTGVNGAIIGTTNPAHILDIIGVDSFNLDNSEYSALKKLGQDAAKFIDFSKNMWGWTPKK